MPYWRSDDAPVRRVDRNLASYVRPAPLGSERVHVPQTSERMSGLSFTVMFRLHNPLMLWFRRCLDFRLAKPLDTQKCASQLGVYTLIETDP